MLKKKFAFLQVSMCWVGYLYYLFYIFISITNTILMKKNCFIPAAYVYMNIISRNKKATSSSLG